MPLHAARLSPTLRLGTIGHPVQVRTFIAAAAAASPSLRFQRHNLSSRSSLSPRARLHPTSTLPQSSTTRRSMTSTATTGGAGASSHGGTGFPAARLNHLANSTSPYLLQHKEDPVDWYEFSDEAFAKARRENKLVFLSIGYSSCHWCHQMRYDSFSQPEVADALNRSFVSIKVDREERPDVDATYMQFVMALNGSGGWPLSAFLTPDAKPLFGGTFFPRRQFLGILDKLATMWTEERHSCLASADGIAAQLSSQLGPRSGSKLDQLPSDRLGIKAAEHWLKRFDAENGGFGDAPKFPTVSNTHHLLHRVVALAGNGGPSDEWKTVEVRELADRALYASLFTLLKISRGGITDQLGGGIARYSVDDEWRVPHFEKMLYDQAQLLTVFCEAIQLARQSGDATLRGMVPELEGTARGIVGYLKTDLSNEAGGLFSAEDADSLPTSASATKKEGAFYVWELDEVETLLGRDSDEARLVVAHYGMRRDGNVPAESDPHGELTGQNMLHAVGPVADTARTVGLDVERAQRTLAAAKAKMLERRNAGRPRPHRDDKIIAAWNGLALSGLCKAAEVLPAGPGGSAEAREMALAAARFLIEHLYSAEQNRLRRSWRDGRVGPWGFSSDYAFVTQGLLDLYELEGDPEHLELAVRLQQRLDTGFWDERVGGYFISEDASGASSRAADVVGQGEGDRDGDGDGDRTGEGDGSALLTRQKDEQDGAEPSATSVAAHNLLRLGWTLDRVPTTAATALPWEERRDAVIKAGGVVLERAAFALGTLTTALLGVHDGGQQILLAGPGLSASSRSGPGAEVQATTTSKTEAEQRERGKAAAMRDAVRRRFGPYRSVVQVDLDRVAEPRYQWLAQHNAAVASLLQRSTAGEAEAHVCENFACGMPIRDVDGFVKRLEG